MPPFLTWLVENEWLFNSTSVFFHQPWSYSTHNSLKNSTLYHQEIPKKDGGAPEFWCPGTRTLVPFPAENRFFVLISRMGIRNINFSFSLSVFICSRHFLVLMEHRQHKFENDIKKTPKKNVGAPEFWCPGTRTLVPPMFLTVNISISPAPHT